MKVPTRVRAAAPPPRASLRLTLGVALCTTWSLWAQADPQARIMSKLQFTPRADSTLSGAARLVVSDDSARIVSPPEGRAITGGPVVYRVEPRVAVDSVMLTVRHSRASVETLGVVHQAPFERQWDPAGIPDQDQVHLQFGYMLYRPGLPPISSGPLPHRWVLDRHHRHSRRSSSCHEILPPDSITVDGALGDWGRTRRASIGRAGHFMLRWTSAKLYLAAEIRDDQITLGDIVELHVDMHQSRAPFAGINHRSIRFGPKTRSNVHVVALTDSGPVVSDSVNVRVSREMEWRARQTGTHYTIEAMIPFCVLSDLEFPSKRLGVDVSVVDVDSGGPAEPASFASWAGSRFESRGNPSEWGTVVLRQGWFPLKLTLGFLALLSIGGLVFVLGMWLRQSHLDSKFARLEKVRLSPRLQSILDHLTTSLGSAGCSIDSVAAQAGVSARDIEELLESEIGATFERYLLFERVRKARHLLRATDLDLGSITAQCGFTSQEELDTGFAALMNTSPERYRARAKLELDDDSDEG